MSQKRKEIDEVTQKVLNTKREIDQLKVELEKLIKSGINSANNFKPDTLDKYDYSHESRHKPETRITFKNVLDTDVHPDLRNTHVSRRDATKLQVTRSDGSINRNTSKSPDCNKKCSYNREEAREYIKKQKEKRKEQAKFSGKDNVIDVEAKKQKLKELHKKSLQLVKKNVEQKRKRSQSRETVKQTENVAQEKTGCHGVSHIPDLIMTNVVDKQKSAQKSDKNDEITEKSSRMCDDKLSNNVQAPVRQQIKNVALKRNYKLPVEQPDSQKNSLDSHNKAATKIQSCFRGYRQRKFNKTMKQIKNQINPIDAPKATAETQTEAVAEAIPDWLNPLTLSHPYNFISTVKRKLNFAITSGSPNLKVCSNIGAEAETPKQELFQKTKNELKEVVEKSSKSKNGNLWDLLSQKRALIADIHSKAVQNSDSDTSKNIPNISSESSIHSTIQKQRAKNDISLDTDYPTDSDFSEPKLNTDRLKSLQLQRKKRSHDTESRKTVASSSIHHQLKASINSKSGSTMSTISESDIISSNTSKYSAHSKKMSVEDLPGKSTVTVDDIIAFNVSPTRSTNENISKRFNSQTSTIQTDLKSASKDLYSSDFSVLSSQKLTVPSLNHPMEENQTVSIVSSKSALEAPPLKHPLVTMEENKSHSVLSSKKLLEVPPLKHPGVTMEENKPHSVISSKNLLEVPPLQYPEVAVYPPRENEKVTATKSVISLKEGDKATLDTKGSVNEIHLKIEAELHFLNDFNESFKKFVDLEKSVLELQDKHKQSSVAKMRDVRKSASESEIEELQIATEKGDKEIKTINYSRGCDVPDNASFYSLNSDLGIEKSTGLELSDFNDTKDTSVSEINNEYSITIDESLLKTPFVGVSLGMFEQLIKDEDTRIENLKTILKIREKALLDRTKSELTLLEIQKKHLKETGQLHEASLLKKKQRGILMRLQHEHHEMQRLKQMQKTASKERKVALKQQRNMIKAQLSTQKMLTKTKVNTPRENQRHSGPFKVYNIQSHSESVKSETSISRNSVTEEIVSVTSHSRSVVSRASDVEVLQLKNENVKSLLMREAALQKRRKAAEELLQWHKKLMEEEKKVAELEMVANSIINEVSKVNAEEKLQKMTKKEDAVLKDRVLAQRNKYKSGKFSEKDSSYDSINTDVEYSSDVSNVIKTDVLIPKQSDSDKQTLNNYTSDFETPTSLNNKELSSEKLKHSDKIASITELIDNLTKINEENSILSKRSSLNKSIDAEIDKIASICTDTKSKSPTTDFKVETNKLWNLKEHLHLDNRKAILDSIENLKSSIQEITSKADRSRGSRRTGLKSDTQSTEKDVSDFTSGSAESILSANIPNDSKSEVIVNAVETEEIEKSSQENSEQTTESIENESREDCVKSAEVISENVESESESPVKISVVQEEEEEVINSLNSEQESSNDHSSVKTLSEVTVEENKTLPEIAHVIESECNDKSSEPTEIILSASSPFIENSKLTEFEDENEGLQLQSEETNKEIEISAESSIKEINEDGAEDIHVLYQPQYEDISDVSENNVTSNADTLNELSNNSVFSFAEQPQTDIEAHLNENETLSQTKSVSELSDQSKNEKSEIQPIYVDVRKRVSELLADANSIGKSERSPRVQDLYVTTYDINSPENSPKSCSPVDNNNADVILSSKGIYDSEAEELLKKQLAIEQEIKRIEQQQKEQIPYIFMREIPNKPPPPYTPLVPVQTTTAVLSSVLPPTVEQIDTASDFATEILFKAHLDNHLENVSFEDQTFDDSILKSIEKGCLKFLFDMCKELALEHYEKFKTNEGPSWVKLVSKEKLSLNGPFNKVELNGYLKKKLRILLGYEKVERRENAIIRWSRKKRDHVDEILVLESQAEESEWTSYDRDELNVKNDVTNEIMNMLLSETAEVLSQVLMKKSKKLLL